jgi:hypothetical protein
LCWASVGEVCALRVDCGAGGLLMSSMLRMAPVRGGFEMPLLVPAIEACRGGAGSSDISNILRTGDLGVRNGEDVLPPEPAELAEPRCTRVGWVDPSSSASTLFLSSSSAASMDIIGFAIATFSFCLESSYDSASFVYGAHAVAMSFS